MIPQRAFTVLTMQLPKSGFKSIPVAAFPDFNATLWVFHLQLTLQASSTILQYVIKTDSLALNASLSEATAISSKEIKRSLCCRQSAQTPTVGNRTISPTQWGRLVADG